MPRISLKTYGFRAATLLWGRKIAVLTLALLAGAGLAIAALSHFASVPMAIVALFVPPAAVVAAIGVAGAALKIKSKIAALQSLVEASAAFDRGFAEKISELRSNNAGLRFLIEERTNELAVEQARLGKILDAHTRRIEKEFQTLEKLALRERETIKSVAALREEVADAKRRARDAEGKAVEFLNQFKKVDEKLASKAPAHKLDEIALTSLAATDELRRIRAQLQGHHVHERYLSKQDIERLRSEWAAPFGGMHSAAAINYIASRIRSIENRCSGRLATASQTMIARILSAQSTPGPDLRILEIGVLFGVASACFHRICSEYGRKVHLTLIDPFEGYYDRSDGDVITGVPVARAIFDGNMEACSVPPSDYSVLQGMSDDPAIIAAAASADYDVLLIDGDHSFDGVRRDYENFRTMVRPGGVILFDDYDVNEWPDIKRFVDGEPAADPALTFVAKGFRTAAFRVDKPL